MSATEETPGVDMSFLSTHPSSKNRTVQVREWAEEVSRRSWARVRIGRLEELLMTRRTGYPRSTYRMRTA